ncbi:MAG: hypothetical protein KJ896_00550, partial [Nanoarchaeota archaeon]|nr:hypothetical protein [Nanoarchaeota archaeon]
MNAAKTLGLVEEKDKFSSKFQRLDTEKRKLRQLEQELNVRKYCKEISFTDYTNKKAKLNQLFGVIDNKYLELKVKLEKLKEKENSKKLEGKKGTSNNGNHNKYPFHNFSGTKIYSSLAIIIILLASIFFVGNIYFDQDTFFGFNLSLIG